MKRLEAVLDQVLEKAIGKALTTLEERAATLIVAPLEEALRRRVEALLGEETLAMPTSPTLRAKAKAAKAIEATPEGEEASPTPAKAPRKRKATATQTLPQEDLATIIGGVEAALARYAGLTTPRGKSLPDVLLRRVRKVLQHAQSLGRTDLASLARSALAIIATDPKGVAMASWQSLAAKLGLPIPVAQA